MTNTICEAESFDSKNEPLKASQAYEQAICEKSASLRHFVNLMVLYFCCLDSGYAANKKLSQTFLDYCYSRIFELARIIEVEFGTCAEAIFWAEYTKLRILGERQNEDIWRKYLEENSTLVPLIYFLEDIKNGKYINKVENLKSEIKNDETFRSRYISSILSNACMPY